MHRINFLPHCSACVVRQPVKESLFSALRSERTYTVLQSGRSMVEMLGVLAIIAILSAGALAGYSQAMKKHKLNQTLEQVQSIVSNVHSKFAHTMRPEEISLEQAIQMGIFPENMIKSATELTNKYQGRVTFETATYDGKKVYKLKFDGLPKETAIAVSTADYDKSMVKVIINEAEE